MSKSTLTQLLLQTQTILDMLEHGENVEIIYLDFAKAYDKLDHQILLMKLEKIGIKGNNLKWIKSWLTNRKQSVKINGVLST